MKKLSTPILFGIILLILLGLAFISYPFVSDWYNTRHHIEAQVAYDEQVQEKSEEALNAELQKAADYNATLTGQGVVDPFIPGALQELPPDYLNILDVNNGMMASISIPEIEVSLPIYHGTSSEVLEKGVGHMEMTAFPIGGAGNHSVLTGHTALPSATLFSDLDDLEVGDEFYIKVLKKTLAYRVDQILVVEPSDTKALAPSPEKDYISLVTCTPYGVNSHRLIVRGERIPYEESEMAGNEGQSMASAGWDSLVIPLIAALVVGTLVVVVVIRRRQKKKRERVAEKAAQEAQATQAEQAVQAVRTDRETRVGR